jgi:hypothetical protein
MKYKYIVLSGVLFLEIMAAGAQITKVMDVKNVLGPRSCSQCHKESFKAWQKTHHFMNYKKFSKNKDTKKIARIMGVKRVKSDGLCATCHYTLGKKGRKVKPIAGVSCESCHGPAKQWIKIHNKVSLKNHVQLAEAKGFVSPGNLYKAYSNCYQCHLVGNEGLVNKTSHAAGSDFDLVSWANGEVRHIFQGKKKNPPLPLAQQQVMLVVGEALNIEYALRALADAKAEGRYSKAMEQKIRDSLTKLTQMNAIIKNAKVSAMIQAVPLASVKVGNDSLIKIANSVKAENQGFIASCKASDGQYSACKLAALDKFLPTKVIGKSYR